MTFVIFRPLEEQDTEGEYTCIASNEDGTVTATRFLDVRSKCGPDPPLGSFFWVPWVMVTVVAVVLGPLEELVSNQNRSMLNRRVGDTVIFNCPLSELAMEMGFEFEPGYSVSWEKRRSGVFPINRSTFTCENESLVLVQAMMEDNGQFVCRVQEPSGRIFEFVFFLAIFGKSLSL